jgi:Zn-finger nucleic acid-binding protein
MITLELEGVEIDYCQSCEGIWLDEGELELTLGGTEKADEFVKSFTKAKNSTEKPRHCPICLKKMQKVFAGGDVLIDRCRKKHGLWLDGGELEQILDNAQLDQADKIKNILADMFGKNMIN